jgi:cation diffusion facilitator CzcD-associated flavoprotein CzcO
MVERENKFIDKYVKLRHQIMSAEWTDEDAKWKVTVKDLEGGGVSEEWVDVLLNGGGILNNWKWPDTPGLKSFKGKLLHSARWDDDYDFTDKRVAVIGAGSSAVQIIPTIYPKVKSLYHWVRSPVWITAGFAQAFAGKEGKNYECTSELYSYPNQIPT